MRRIDTNKLKPGMIVARTIFSPTGEPLLKPGIELKNHYINNLKRLGINNVYIRDERLEGVEYSDVVSDESRLEAKRIIYDYFSVKERFKFLGDLEKSLIKTADRIVNEILNRKEIVLNLQDIKSSDSYTYDHCVNVCILSVIAGMKLNLSRDELVQIALGSSIHDIGKLDIPGDILNKPTVLTREEFSIVKEHTRKGYERFQRGSFTSEAVGNIILQHHERHAGHGYPFGLKDKEIDRMAQIVSIADVYDALTSTRPYRKAYYPHNAVEMFLSVGGVDFNIDVLNAFLSFIPSFPVGTHVVLNNQESGLVINNTPGFSTRPTVRILYEGPDLTPHHSPYEVSLVENTGLVVAGMIDGEGIYQHLRSVPTNRETTP